MNEVSWIKLYIDVFSNRKIRHILKMPHGESIVIIWLMLLTMAGRCNAGGKIFFTEDIPYTISMLAQEMEYKENLVQLSLQTLAQFGMIEIDTDGIIAISSWDKYQNIEGMERIREQNRIRKQKQREREAAATMV